MKGGQTSAASSCSGTQARFSGICSRIIAWIYPERCAGCRRVFRPPSGAGGGRLGRYLCPGCLAKTEPIVPPLCTRCGLPFATAAGPGHLCGDCIGAGRPFEKARAVFTYQGPVRELVRGLKYHGRTDLARPLGRLMLDTLRCYWDLGEFDLAVPVPLHRRRERRRTYNQAWLLLRGLKRAAAGQGLANLPFAIEKGVLSRRRPTRPQAGLSRSRRRENIRRAFEVCRPDLVRGRRVLLADDVMTTGATAEACCRCLLRGGAEKVDVLVLARAG